MHYAFGHARRDWLDVNGMNNPLNAKQLMTNFGSDLPDIVNISYRRNQANHQS
jgi:hypothetical protein